MTPETRRQVDTVLGWVGYSLSYTEQDAGALASGPALEQVPSHHASARVDSPASALGTPDAAGNTSNARLVLVQMLEAFAEGLYVCAGVAARFISATYRYCGQLLREYMNRDDDRRGHGGPMRPTLRVRIDEGLERVLDVAEARVRALSPIPAVRRARTAVAVEAADRMERITDRGSRLATTLSPARAFDRTKGALRAKVAKVNDSAAALMRAGSRPSGTEREEESQPADASADLRMARIWWPEKEREDEDMSIAASRAEAQAEAPAPVVEPIVVNPTLTAETVVEFRVDTPRPELKESSSSAGPSADAPPPLSEPAPVAPVETLSLLDTTESSTGISSSIDSIGPTDPIEPAEAAIESFPDVESDDRPWFLRWSSFFSFLRPRETRAPSLLGQSPEDDVADVAASDGAVSEPEPERSIALERLEKMLDSSRDNAPTEAELKALSERGPRYL